MKNKIIVITGPTATGKTSLGIEIANRYNGEIISCDSMQIYKHLDIGTAKPTEIEKQQAKHHLIDFVNPNSSFSVQEYVTKADDIIKNLFEQNKLPIIVGGTGLYIKSLIYPYSFCSAPKNEIIRNKYKTLLETNGKDYIYNLLKEKDPKACEKIHINDTKRVIRALEICEITGNNKTELNNEQIEPKYDVIMIGLNMPREELYERINRRVDVMFNQGLVAEVEKVINSNITTFGSQSMEAIGYKEFKPFFDGTATEQDVKEHIAKNSRNYAKRQITFIKGFKNLKWFNPLTQKDEILKFIDEELKK